MGDYAVIKGSSYILAHVPDVLINSGSTQLTEKIVNPESEYLAALRDHIRSYDDVLAYPPNQVYIGNLSNRELSDMEFPWFGTKAAHPAREGKFGEIMPQDEFYGLMQISDVFDLVELDKEFAAGVKEKLERRSMFSQEQLDILDKNSENDAQFLSELVNCEGASGLYSNGVLVGAVKKAHDIDVNLSSHVMLENIASKASGVLSLMNLVKVTGIDKNSIEYVIDCSEEACGDMNQRGGGNFAKAAAETAGITNATGSDVRGFCAGPAHSIIEAASLVKAGTYKTVVVFAGGCTAKLGMNGKDHVKKSMPLLEDCLGGFAVLIGENDAISPEIRNDIVGRHTVGTGSSPQAVISSLVTDPLDRAGMKITDIDKYAPELQNPDITKPAGAGDVPEANFKMIGALGVKLGQLERSQLNDFIRDHGMKGWAPTQGHIPSGVPYLGTAREDIMNGTIKRAMIIGKGSLFLGRMTNQFDGVSFVIEQNHHLASDKQAGDDKLNINAAENACCKAVSAEADSGVVMSKGGAAPLIGVAAPGTELGLEEMRLGIEKACRMGYNAILIEDSDPHKAMERMLKAGDIDGAVTMHYPFPIGVSTVGRVITPSRGKEMFLATTTGTMSTDRTCGMVLNAINGIIAAKASGVCNPTVGIANVDGARQAEKALKKLSENGYGINFASSERADGGIVMRGNDLLAATADVMVMDPLTGNLMMKLFSAFTTGGGYESTGFGYGPGIGEDYGQVISIISRASGAPVIANAIAYTSEMISNGMLEVAKNEYSKARRAGLDGILDGLSGKLSSKETKSDAPSADAPAKEVVTYEIHGIEVTELDEATAVLAKAGIYAETGMGCTGPVILVNDRNGENARNILKENNYID